MLASIYSFKISLIHLQIFLSRTSNKWKNSTNMKYYIVPVFDKLTIRLCATPELYLVL